jgi:hypothetical protein
MPNKYIYCISCNLYLGEIKEATLRKNIYYLCNNCKEKWKAANDMAELSRKGKGAPDFINDLFGSFKK